MSRPRSTAAMSGTAAEGVPQGVPGAGVPGAGVPGVPPANAAALDREAALERLEQMRSQRGWLFLGALALGVLWGIASAHFGVRWSWPIVAVGAGMGFAWSRVGQGSAVWAVGLTAGTYFIAVVAAATMSRYYPSDRMIQQQPAVLQAAVHLWMEEHDELPAISGVGLGSDDAVGDLGPEIITAFDVEQLVKKEMAALSPAMRRTVLAWYHDKAGGRAGNQRIQTFGGRVVGAMWLAAGLWIAWRLSGRNEEINL